MELCLSEPSPVRPPGKLCLDVHSIDNPNSSYSVGTGWPSIIADAYLNQCQSILSACEPTKTDEMMVSEILLFSLLEKLLARSQAMGVDGSCNELEEWNRR